MRGLIFLALIVIVLALVGWLTFSNEADRSSINLETERIQENTQQMLESGSEALRDAGDSIDADQATETSEPVEPATTSVDE